MRNRLHKPRPLPAANLFSFDIHQDSRRVSFHAEPSSATPDEPLRSSLAPASLGLMNSRTMAKGAQHRDSKPLPSVPISPAQSPRASQNGFATNPRRMSTIRAVPSFDERNRPSFDDEASSDGSPSVARHSASAFSSSGHSNVSAISLGSQPQPNGFHSPTERLKQGVGDMSLGTVSVSPALSGPEHPLASGMEIPQRDSSLGVMVARSTGRAGLGPPLTTTSQTLSPAVEVSAPLERPQDEGQGTTPLGVNDTQLSHGWDSTVGKAGLGKTGRVINRLVSDNEALKRDLKIERLKAEESRQAARLLEDRMERMVSDYESRLLEATVTKTLLSRKERQVESLQATLELEKKRTADAQDRERTWREEMEKLRSETKQQVEKAANHASLMEGRYNAISSHWRDQGDEVKRAMARMGKEVQQLLEERQRDDDKITVLRDLCDQQDGNIKDLQRQKEAMARKFDEYKDEQENSLHDIKTAATLREAQQEQTLEEAREVLDKLKWALSTKENIGWAQ